MTPHRIEILTEIASRWLELTDPVFGRDPFAGGYGGGPHMPSTYTPTVREFERLERLMRHTSDQVGKYEGYRLKTLSFHLQGWYMTAERIFRMEPVVVVSHGKRRQLRNGDGSLKTRPVIQYRRHPDAIQARADLAIRWIAERWGLSGEPFLPKEIFEVAA